MKRCLILSFIVCCVHAASKAALSQANIFLKTYVSAKPAINASFYTKVEEQTCFITGILEKDGNVFIQADYILRLNGEQAIQEAKKRGDADTTFINGKMSIAVVNDYYIINDNHKIRKLLLDPAVTFEFVENPDRYAGKVANTLQGLKMIYKDSPFTLRLKEGRVTNVTETFVP